MGEKDFLIKTDYILFVVKILAPKSKIMLYFVTLKRKASSIIKSFF